LEKWASPRLPADRLLTLLKRSGPQTAAELGQALGTTGENARQQLVRLAQDGFAEAAPVARGVGRPVQLWRLTEAAEARFPDAHAELTVSLLRHMRSVLGQAALDRVIEARERETRTAYRQALAGAGDIEARLARLAALRSAEGYMAEWQRLPEGDWLLVENHCPICAAATACQGFCRAELAIFRDVLGPGCRVEREEHILHGARRCAYRITRGEAGA
jgi:predicted ArsR family transcriptional regulator